MSIGVIIAYILAALGAGIVLVHVAVAVGTVITRVKERALLRRAGDASAAAPSVSVIVPARNEQFALPRLLASFDAQESGEFEVVLVNDRSSDQTADVMEEYRARHPDSVRVVALTEAPDGANPKQNALAHGAEVAGGEIILLTDADCVVPAQWIGRMSRYLADPRVGLVFGPV
ncbi:MAG: glycosyltransferase, partial [Spirochaetes bacterium]|nr:glycosyltransferase [Spirochaetota bacterium]